MDWDGAPPEHGVSDDKHLRPAYHLRLWVRQIPDVAAEHSLRRCANHSHRHLLLGLLEDKAEIRGLGGLHASRSGGHGDALRARPQRIQPTRVTRSVLLPCLSVCRESPPPLVDCGEYCRGNQEIHHALALPGWSIRGGHRGPAAVQRGPGPDISPRCTECACDLYGLDCMRRASTVQSSLLEQAAEKEAGPEWEECGCY